MKHDRAIELLSARIYAWYKQIQEMRVQGLPDLAAREKKVRELCHDVEESVKALEGLQPKALKGSLAEGALRQDSGQAESTEKEKKIDKIDGMDGWGK